MYWCGNPNSWYNRYTKHECYKRIADNVSWREATGAAREQVPQLS